MYEDGTVVDVNERGGKQSLIEVAYHLIDPYALREIAKVLYHGAAKYGIDNWRLIPAKEHANHALNHIYLWLSGDRTENHLVNAACRMIFAIAMQKEEENGRQ